MTERLCRVERMSAMERLQVRRGQMWETHSRGNQRALQHLVLDTSSAALDMCSTRFSISSIARPRLLQYSYYDIVTQPAARQPSPIATLECAPYKIFFIIFRYQQPIATLECAPCKIFFIIFATS